MRSHMFYALLLAAQNPPEPLLVRADPVDHWREPEPLATAPDLPNFNRLFDMDGGYGYGAALRPPTRPQNQRKRRKAQRRRGC
jgi:hypothetical protein